MESLLTSVAVVFCLLAIQPPVAKAAGAPADAIQPNSVWVGEKLTLTILERTGDTFRARFETGNAVREITGTVKDNKISWLAKDVHAVRGDAGHDNFGTIIGNRIDFTYGNGGKFTLTASTASTAPAPAEQPKTAKPEESFTNEIHPGTVWESSSSRVLTILERKGDAFRGRFENDKVVDEVSGTIKDNKISWLHKDAGPDPANPAGTFGTVLDGKIDFTWRNEKGDTGKFALVHGFVDRTFHGPGGKTLFYKFYVPEHYDKTKQYPVVLLFHGYDVRPIGAKWPTIKGRVFRFITPEEQAKNPCIVIAPISSSGGWMGISDAAFKKPMPLSTKPAEEIELALGALGEVMKSHSVDGSRVYLMGYSNGAYAVWDLLARYPNRWAAAGVILRESRRRRMCRSGRRTEPPTRRCRSSAQGS